MKEKEKTQRITGSQLRAEYAMAIFDWCRAYPQGTLNELLELIYICESRVAEINLQCEQKPLFIKPSLQTRRGHTGRKAQRAGLM